MMLKTELHTRAMRRLVNSIPAPHDWSRQRCGNFKFKILRAPASSAGTCEMRRPNSNYVARHTQMIEHLLNEVVTASKALPGNR